MRVLFWILLLLPAALPAQGVPERWNLVEELRIGSVDGPHALTRVHALTVSPNRRLVYVGLREEHTIRVFEAATGRSMRSIGRSGAGPGEFQGMARIGWKQDTLFAADGSLQRMSLFSPEGESTCGRSASFPSRLPQRVVPRWSAPTWRTGRCSAPRPSRSEQPSPGASRPIPGSR